MHKANLAQPPMLDAQNISSECNKKLHPATTLCFCTKKKDENDTNWTYQENGWIDWAETFKSLVKVYKWGLELEIVAQIGLILAKNQFYVMKKTISVVDGRHYYCDALLMTTVPEYATNNLKTKIIVRDHI